VADLPGQPAVFKPNKWPILPKYAVTSFRLVVGVGRDKFLNINFTGIISITGYK